MDKSTPIKRHQALVSFSRDHHNGLLLAWKVRQGLKNLVEPERISDYVLFAFKNELEQHFKDEEKWLFPELPADDGLRIQAETDHAGMRGLITQLGSDKKDIAALTQFADLLEKHIRFEERELFNHLQEIPTERLLPIAARFKDHFCQSEDGWEDPFWT